MDTDKKMHDWSGPGQHLVFLKSVFIRVHPWLEKTKTPLPFGSGVQ